MTPQKYLRIAINRPLDQLFDYALTEECDVFPGQRVLIPFGRESLVGIIVEITTHSTCEPERIRPILRILDPQPVLDDATLALLRFTARYYHHPLGETLAHALPPFLRQNKPILSPKSPEPRWRTSVHPPDIRLGPRQRTIVSILAQAEEGLTRTELSKHLQKTIREVEMQRLESLGVVARREETAPLASIHQPTANSAQASLTIPQTEAIATITGQLGQGKVFLLDGVTGSGKTEVYLEVARQVVATGGQVLLLVPEIALTPQTQERVERYFPGNVSVLHSDLPDRERMHLWNAARTGLRSIVLGTRSAIFVPLPKLQLIIVDEEHDGAYKQQEGLRYHARDLAIFRAYTQKIPIILGSATPTLESWRRAREEQYHWLHLDTRPDGSLPPTIRCIDTRVHRRDEGLSLPLLQAMQETLSAESNCLLLLNRRGYARILGCDSCGWVADCPRCDAHQTVHIHSQQSTCHHCGYSRKLLHDCPQCGSRLTHHGTGTERLEHVLAKHFPDRPLLRMDRDSIRHRGALETILARIRSLKGGIVVGTQMLAKGHDFARIGLVGVIDIDQGLFSVDLRAAEHTMQLVQQAAGRAGRDGSPATVWLQTGHPDHPLIETLRKGHYPALADQLLEERRRSHWPPFGHIVLIRFDAAEPETALQAAQQVTDQLRARHPAIRILGPAPAPKHRVNLRFREQILLFCQRRAPLHAALNEVENVREVIRQQRKIRLSIDVDPLTLA